MFFYHYFSEVTHIEEQHFQNNQYEKPQIEMAKNFLRSDDTASRKVTMTPSATDEAGFTRLLADVVDEKRASGDGAGDTNARLVSPLLPCMISVSMLCHVFFYPFILLF